MARRAGDVFLPGAGSPPQPGASTGKIFGLNKWLVIAAVGIGLVVAYIIYRRSQSGSSSSSGSSGTTTSPGVDPNAVDPATGLTYGEEEALAQQDTGAATGGAGSGGSTGGTPTGSAGGAFAGAQAIGADFKSLSDELAAIQTQLSTSGSTTTTTNNYYSTTGGGSPAAALPSAQTTLPAATIGLSTQTPGEPTGSSQFVGGNGGGGEISLITTPTKASTAVSTKAQTALSGAVAKGSGAKAVGSGTTTHALGGGL
jgi:hypothetical protein